MAPFRVLSLDGGGMRGIYTAQYLASVSDGFSQRLKKRRLDVGKGFDLIVGTSTGAIVACALAAAVPLQDVVDLYRKNGKLIFPRRLPSNMGVGLARDLYKRPSALKKGSAALEEALSTCFQKETMGDLYQRRGIAVAITAVNLSNHRSWVFKTPHLANSNHRDDRYRLVDVCLASSAAPIFRSVAAVSFPDGDTGYNAFIDGGLWANNPVLVGLLDALELASADQPIEVFSLGACPRPAGTPIKQTDVHRGLLQWKFGADAAAIAIDAQEFAFDQMARMFAKHLKRSCRIVRFPREAVPAAMMQYLDLDDTRNEAADALVQVARTDADMTNSRCANSNDSDGVLVNALFQAIPERPENAVNKTTEVKQ
ncbi:MAG: patatin-like phospholipase family protein [Bryobacterales bacterium]|nr:patatin-like phospholipase family protein [Bryobacterales bacterium]